MVERTKGLLVLEDGSVFPGYSMGAQGEFVGELVFNTSMTGYQEIITDPSYWGQMVTFTCPHIGNVGINREDAESCEPMVRAILVREMCETPSNWRAQQSLPEYLVEYNIPALVGLDTRRLTLTLRDKGVMRAALATNSTDSARLLEMARNAPDMSALSPVEQVDTEAVSDWAEPVAEAWNAIKAKQKDAPHVVVIDCGIKHNILRILKTLGARVTVVPANTSATDILTLNPNGVLISNGPGDPVQVPATVESVQQLMGQVPIFGICLGHQIIGLACGAKTYKLPFGHHGGNHPVKNLATGQVEITAQNHNYAVDAESIKDLPLEVTRINLYDNTIEGLKHTKMPIWSVQYHPEASPGPHDSLHELASFVASIA